MNRYEPINMFKLRNFLTQKGPEGRNVWETILLSQNVRRDLRFWLPFIDTTVDGETYYNRQYNVAHVEVVDLIGLRDEIIQVHTRFGNVLTMIEECECIPEALRRFISNKLTQVSTI